MKPTTSLLALGLPDRDLRGTGLALATVDIVISVDILTLVVTRRRDGGRGDR